MTREPKKTEMLEIRVSSETKSALQAKARDDGKSVSEVLRHLIAQYLGLQPLAHQRRRNIMRLSSLTAGAAALVLAVIALTPSANAGGMLLGLSALIELRTPQSSSHQIIETTVQLDFGKEILLCVPAEGEARAPIRAASANSCGFDDASGYAILLSANAAPDDSVLIRAHVLSEGETTMPETASAFLVKLDSWAAMQTQTDQGAQSMRLTFFPRRL